MHSRARMPPRYGGTISSSSKSVKSESLKSEPPSVKKSPSVKSEYLKCELNHRSISRPRSSVGSRTAYGGSISRSGSAAASMFGSYYGSNRVSLGSHSSAPTSAKSALSGRTSYGGSTSAETGAKPAGSNGSGSLSTLQYGGSADERPRGSRRGTS